MDDFTQGMAERARQRREALNQRKMADTPIRKRGVYPENEESKEGSGLTDNTKDDSPNKRPCLQDLENQMNSQVVAPNETRISAVMKNDCSSKTSIDTENLTIEAPLTQKSYFSTESESKTAHIGIGSQRGRFAALAERYNTWEDDLSHHDFRKEEKKPSKADKYRYPQQEGSTNVPEACKNAPVASKIATELTTDVPVRRRDISETNTRVQEMTKRAPEATANASSASKVAHKMPENDISVACLSETPRGGKFEAAEKEAAEPFIVPPVAVTRAVVEEPVCAQTSPSDRVEEEIVVPLPPTITVPSSVAAEAKTKELGNDGKTGHVSSLTFMIGGKGKGSVSENNRTASSFVSAPRTVSVPCAVSTPGCVPVSGSASVPNVIKKAPHLSLKSANLNESVSEEPTRKPVSARLAAWQTKVSANEEKPSVNARVRMLERKCGDREPKRSPLSKSNTPTGSSPRAIQGSPAKSPSIRGGALQKRSSSRKSKSALTVSPLTKTTPPAKVQPATQNMHDRLSKFCEARTSELVEKSRAGRAAELAMLENRWKNGVLVEGDRSVSSSEASSFKSAALNSSAIAPAAPPLLPDVSVGASSPSTPNRRRSRSADSPASAHSVKSARKEEARNRIREDFESKLRMMGFDVNSSGTTAAVQLDSIVEHDVDKSKSVGMPLVKQPQDSPGKSLTGKLIDVADGKKLECAKAPNSTTTGAATGSSIYNLIRKQIGSASATTPASTPAVMTSASAFPTSVPCSVLTGSQSRTGEERKVRRRSMEDEPVESEMDSFDELAEFKKPMAVAAAKVMRPVAVTFSASVQEFSMSEQSGGESVDSGSQFSESESCSTDNGPAHEDDDDSEMDEEDSEEEKGDGAVDDLLDEAMMDSLEEEEKEKERAVPVAQPAPAPCQQEPPSNASAAKTQVVMRHPNGRREAAEANEDGKPRGYISLQQYRQEQARPKSQPPGPSYGQRDAMALKRATVMTTEHGHGVVPSNGDAAYYGQRRDLAGTGSTSQSRNSPSKRTRGLYPDLTVELSGGAEGRHRDEDKMPYIPEKSAKQRIQELQDLVRQELNVIEQTSNALTQCCHGGSAFAGSAEAVECNRLLLMACKKREAYLVEMQRLRERPMTLNPEGPKGRLTISDIRLPLKADFASRIGTTGDTSVHYFLVMIHHGSHIVFTQMVSSHEAAARGSIDFPNLINLPNINQRFLVDLEVYAMSVARDNDALTPKKKKGMTPKKLLTPRSSRTLQSPGGPYVVRSTNFANVASLQLTMSQLNKTHFTLERVPFSSPLQGSVHLKLKCLIESHIEEKGFLTMFEDVSGFGAWHRRWFLLKGGRLAYWRYPDEEKDNREPIGVIDLKSCVSDRIDLVSREACARPNTFELTVIRKQQRGERDTLVTKCYDTLSTTKQWISADTKEERLAWCAKLNETLVNIRAWHSDALRPIKPRN